jgi:two-component system, chemotaxis family, response regulator Rcp1
MVRGSPGHLPAILLVEDDPVEVRLLQEVFKAIPVCTQLHAVREGDEALAFLRHEAPYQHAPRPALILLSLKLPGMSGEQLLAALKCDPALQSIPALVFTNSQSPQDIAHSYRLGANSYLLKPFDFTHLVEMVHTIVIYWLQVVTPAPPLLPPHHP